MSVPLLRRFAAYGAPQPMAAWRERVVSVLGLARLCTDPVGCIRLETAWVDTFSGTAPADLQAVIDLAAPGVQMLAMWDDQSDTRRWLHIHDGTATTLDVPDPDAVGYVLAHRGSFRGVDLYSDEADSAAAVMGSAASPLAPSRGTFFVFDVDRLWTPSTHNAPDGTVWSGDTLDATELTLGRYFADRLPDWDYQGLKSPFRWEQWAADALCVWFDHTGTKTCELPPWAIASVAGLLGDELRPALRDRQEPASQVIRLVHDLASQELSVQHINSVLPAMLA